MELKNTIKTQSRTSALERRVRTEVLYSPVTGSVLACDTALTLGVFLNKGQ